MSHSKLRTLDHIHAVILMISHVIFAANSNYFIAIGYGSSMRLKTLLRWIELECVLCKHKAAGSIFK